MATKTGKVKNIGVETTQVIQHIISVGRTVVGEGSTEKILDVHIFKTEPAKIEVGISKTINTGDWSSAKVFGSLTMPVYKEEIDTQEKFADVFDCLYKRLGEEIGVKAEEIIGKDFLSESSLEDELGD